MTISGAKLQWIVFKWLLAAFLFVAAIYFLYSVFRGAWRLWSLERVPSRGRTPQGVSKADDIRLFGYHIDYVSPAIVRSGQHDSCFDYVDEMGEITFRSLERSHPSGGGIEFPESDDAWDRKYPGHRGRRELIRRRLVEYAERGGYHPQVVRVLNERASSLWTIAREQWRESQHPPPGKTPPAISEDARRLMALNITVSAKGFEALRCVLMGFLPGVMAISMFVTAAGKNQSLFEQIMFVIMGGTIAFYAVTRFRQLGLRYVFSGGKLTCLGLNQRVLWKEDLATVVEVRAWRMYKGPRHVEIIWPHRQRTIPFVNWWLDP
jgi:hypothetical protein